jgi:hypothetical protein
MGHPVGGQDFLLARDDDGANELARLREDLLKVFVVDDRRRHKSTLLPGNGMAANWRDHI